MQGVADRSVRNKCSVANYFIELFHSWTISRERNKI